MAGSAISNPAKQEKSLIQQIQDARLVTALSKVLPKNLKPDRFVRQTVTMVRKQPDLLKCDPVSVIGGMIQAAELGLEMSGVLGHCFLIPRWNGKRKCKEAVFQMGYKGFRELAYRSGKVTGFHMRTVLRGDEFKCEYGTTPRIRHEPGEKRGPEVTHFYCVAFILGGQQPDFEVMSMQEILAWRQRYSPPPTDKPDYSGWASSFEGMALKTVCGIVARRMPLAVEAAAIMNLEHQAQTEALEFTPGAEQMLEELGQTMPQAGEFEGGPEPAADEPTDNGKA